MKFLKTEIEGAYILDPVVHGDERGYFFESFNEKEFSQKTGLDNVAFPLLIQGQSKKEARKKAKEFLKEVGLEEKEKEGDGDVCDQ